MGAHKPHSIQGAADGLCGFYSLVNYLSPLTSYKFAKDDLPRRKVVLRALLVEAERLQILEARKIVEGFFDYELVTIFNELSRRRKFRLQATTLEKYLIDRGIPIPVTKKDYLPVLRDIFSDGGAAIVQRHGGQHWVLAHAIDDVTGKIKIKDSGHDESSRSAAVSRLSDFQTGVVLIKKAGNK